MSEKYLELVQGALQILSVLSGQPTAVKYSVGGIYY